MAFGAANFPYHTVDAISKNSNIVNGTESSFLA